MLRRLFTLLSALSLLLCVGTCVIWVRSCWVGDTLRVWCADELVRDGTWMTSDPGVVVQSGPTYEITFQMGTVWIEYDRGTRDGTPVTRKGWRFLWQHRAARTLSWDAPTHVWDRIGFHYDSEWYTQNGFTTAGPLWFLFLMTVALPAAWLIRQRCYQKAQIGGRCPTCGYDLRATPDRCPECGAVPILSKR
jgi:hypothetical protein